VRNKGLLFFFALAILFAVVFNLPSSVSRLVKAGARESIAPYQDLTRSSSRATSRFIAAFRNIDDLLDENDRLNRELAQLRIEIQRLRTLDRENTELRSMLRFAQHSPYRLVACEVVGRGDVTGWWQTAHLNKGTADGVWSNMAVITAEGLVGKTVEVSRHTCEVRLITDPDSKIGGKLGRAVSLGIVCGQGFAPLEGRAPLEMLCPIEPFRMEYLPKDAELLKGDEVFTSGLGGVFPPDLVIGRVEKAERDPSGLFQCASVVPSADLSALTRVFVVLQ
jgi:rod shape-determining protein MreC